ncbi:dolichol phosphate-mannose biosynthesis regulatory [Clavulina sp. PMI_390]|nr:dolichol phosphate-mannose biosynthesis regulatory [Clavulina sp. PMI_390]
MAVSDKAIGSLALLIAAVVFSYYTFWAIILPFFPTSHPIHDNFPPREWAVRVPAFLLVVGLSGIGFFLGSTMMKEAQRKKAKALSKQA